MDADAIILAVASPPGRSARGIVRVSGAGAFELLREHVTLDDDAAWERGVHPATLRLLPSELRCLALTLPGPRSYTGEDSAERQLPGNPALLERVIDGLLAAAGRAGRRARRAEPGEFTARAFFSGRLGLTEAEGVAATIAARSDAELRAARLLRSGKLARFARATADEIAATLALVEAGIDFTDQEDVVPIAAGDLRGRLDRNAASIADQLERAVGAEQIEALPWVVLAGSPNAGKSTLFNALLRRERAVVASAPGTTRDVLTHPLTVDTDHGSAEVMLVDAAGIDAAPSALDGLMQEARADAAARAELILLCAPADEATSVAPDHRTIVVRTKADRSGAARGRPPADPGVVPVSAATGAGLDALRALISRRLGDRAVSVAADAIVLRPRHEAALRAALDHVREASALVGATGDGALDEPELVAAAMRAALDAVGAVAGDVSPDDVLGRVFASFCVGK